ncbi:MAG: ArsR/SmtB family transcription factor [Thermoproteota archaeon]
MALKLRLVRDGKTIFEIPLSPMDWPKKKLKKECMAFEKDFQRFSKMFHALSNRTRLRMMGRVVAEKDRTVRFAEFTRDLDLNPKIVWENSRKLREGGFLKKTGRGKYTCSEFGQTAFITMSLALRHLIETIEKIDKKFKGGEKIDR